MAEIAVIVGVLLSVLNTVVAGRTLWKDWKSRTEKPHPLDAAVRDIAAAIRERDQQIQRLDAALKATDEARRRFQWKSQ